MSKNFDYGITSGRRRPTHGYKPPILWIVYNALAVISLFGALFFFLSAERDGGILYTRNMWLALALVVAALIQHGVAQLVDYVGQTAHNTHLNEDILATLERIEKNLTIAQNNEK